MAANALEGVAAASGVPVERDGGAVVPKVTARHHPGLELFRRRIGYHELPEAVPWQEGGPLPLEAVERTNPAEPWQPSWDDPPLEAYQDIIQVLELA